MVILSMKSKLEIIAELVPVDGTLKDKQKTFSIAYEPIYDQKFKVIFEDKLRQLVVFILQDDQYFSDDGCEKH